MHRRGGCTQLDPIEFNSRKDFPTCTACLLALIQLKSVRAQFHAPAPTVLRICHAPPILSGTVHRRRGRRPCHLRPQTIPRRPFCLLQRTISATRSRVRGKFSVPASLVRSGEACIQKQVHAFARRLKAARPVHFKHYPVNFACRNRVILREQGRRLAES